MISFLTVNIKERAKSNVFDNWENCSNEFLIYNYLILYTVKIKWIIFNDRVCFFLKSHYNVILLWYVIFQNLINTLIFIK